jgi:hypothetical protein
MGEGRSVRLSAAARLRKSVCQGEFDVDVVAEGAGFAAWLLPEVAGLELVGAGLELVGAGLELVGAGLELVGAGLLFSDLVGDGELLGAGELEVGAGLGDEGRGCGWLVVWLGAVTSRGGCTE